MNRLVVLTFLVVLGTFACWRAFAGSSDLSRSLAREAKRRQALERNSYQCQQRLEVKHQVINELLAGRMKLARAARRFAEINAASAEESGSASTSISFADEEACARSVLNWAYAALVNDPERRERVMSGLEDAYRQSFQPVLTTRGGQPASAPQPTPTKVAKRQGPPS